MRISVGIILYRRNRCVRSDVKEGGGWRVDGCLKLT